MLESLTKVILNKFAVSDKNEGKKIYAMEKSAAEFKC
jgi:hypothetical protein